MMPPTTLDNDDFELFLKEWKLAGGTVDEWTREDKVRYHLRMNGEPFLQSHCYFPGDGCWALYRWGGIQWTRVREG